MTHCIVRGLGCLRLSLLVFGITLLGSSGAWASCGAGTLFIDLETGQTLPATPPVPITIQALGPSANPYCSGWQSAVLRLDLSPPCREAEITVEYGSSVTAWTVHIADSPTSDGYGGDLGTTPNNAELWINQQILWVAMNQTGTSDNELFEEHLYLPYGALKFTVKNQYIAWGPSYKILKTPHNKKLFALPDTANPAEGYYVYLGLNRVVGNYPARSGCGAQRAMVTVE